LRALAAQAPLLVAIDDVQWLDAPSADALTFAARRLEVDAIRFLLTKRAGVPAPLEQALGDPLSLVLLFPSRRGAILLALELGRAWLSTGHGERSAPDAVKIRLHAGRATPVPVRRLLLVADLSADRRRPAAAIGTAALDDAPRQDPARRRGRASVTPGCPLRRKHSRAAERRELHLWLARTVADEGLRARHLALATEGPDASLAATVASAAAGASARGAAEESVELAEHALRLTPPDSAARSDRLLALADYLVVAGNEERVTDLLSPEADSLPDGAARCRAHLLLAGGGAIANADDLRDHLERAFVESDGDAALRAEVLASKSWHTAVVWVEGISDAEAWALEALPAARQAGPEAERRVLTGLAWARICADSPSTP
jgi:hypothetical protein